MNKNEASELQLIAGALQGLYEKYNDKLILDLQIKIEKLITDATTNKRAN